MHAKILAAFAFGFAAGVSCLAVGLLATGHLSRPLPPAGEAIALAEPSVCRGSADRSTAQGSADRQAAQGSVDRLAPATLHSARLGMPIAGIDPGTLKSNFSETRGSHRHEALDIMAPRGTPVLAAADGKVAKLFTSKPGGLTVYQFDNSQTWCYYYAHLDGYAPGLTQGTLLRQGDVLGYVGSTGDASPNAPHLHFAVFQLGPGKRWWQGTAVDPLPLLMKGQ